MPTVKPLLTIAFLAVFWTWESIAPLVSGRAMRLRHAEPKVAIALFNTAGLGLVFGAVHVWVSALTGAGQSFPAPRVQFSAEQRADLDAVSAYLNGIRPLSARFIHMNPRGGIEQGTF